MNGRFVNMNISYCTLRILFFKVYLLSVDFYLFELYLLIVFPPLPGTFFFMPITFTPLSTLIILLQGFWVKVLYTKFFQPDIDVAEWTYPPYAASTASDFL